MILSNELCDITITLDETYSVESSDNKMYDIELNPDNFKHSDFSHAFSIHVDLHDRKMDIALVGSGYSSVSDCAVLEENVLTIMQDKSISQIDITSGKLLLFKKFECMGTTCGIYAIKDGFIVWGEIEIIRLDSSFDRVWAFSGKDIFVSQTSTIPFSISENRIKLYDWENNYYELDFDGKRILS